MPGVFNLSHILQLVINGFDEGSFAQEHLVTDAHKLSSHIVLQLGNQLNAIHKEPREEVLADVALVPDQLAENLLNERLVPQWLPVIDIAGRYHEVQEVSLLVADEMQFEPVEPSHRALTSLGQSLEDLVEMDTLVPAHPKGRAVDKTNSGAAAHAALLDKKDERNGYFSLQFNKAIVGNCLGKQVLHILLYLVQIKVFQTFITTKVEQYHDGDHFGIGHRAVSMVSPFLLITDGGKPVNLDKSVINLAEIIRHTENFRNFVFGDRHSESVCTLFVL